MNTTHTKGPWRVVHTADDRTFIDFEESSPEFVAQVNRNNPAYEEYAALIAEAGTVASETGKTPRQLAEEHREMLEALRHLQAVVRDEYHLLDIKKRASLCIADAQAGTAIARAEGRG